MSNMHLRLAILTGASRGIGLAIAERLLIAGYSVALWDLNRDAIANIVGECAEAGKPCIGSVVDVANADEVEAATQLAERTFGIPHLLVNNAAIRHRCSLESLARTDWDQEIATNLTGAFQCAQTVGRRMLAAGSGVIINMASLAASFGHPLRGAYSSSKAGLIGLTNTIAVEWGPRGVRCNAVSPGMIVTPAHTTTYDNPEYREGRAAQVPMRRLGTGHDVADVVVFLASDGARYINGANIVVDGALAKSLLAHMPTPAPP
jgi:NAD(P)-dependent dehydrogenase (short-subunit alcohol dehydrogenase family)